MWSTKVNSPTKAEIKHYASLKLKKYRDLEKKFIIEGSHLIEEILTSKYYRDDLEMVFVTNEYPGENIIKTLSKLNIPVHSIDNKSFNKLSDTVSPQGILGIVRIPENKNNPEGNLIVALDEINDPGNMGTILRTAYWFDIPNVVLSKNSVDIHNSKVIRGSQGGIFNVFTRSNIDLHSYLSEKAKEGWIIFLTDLTAENVLSDIELDINGKYIFVFGNEANGISEEIISDDQFRKVKIKSYTDCESLNLGVSVGIVLNYVSAGLK
jgi:TrmH family RNA methyltransferase